MWGWRHYRHGWDVQRVSQVLPSTVHNSRFCAWTLYTFGSLITAKQNDGYLRTNAEQHTCQLCGHGFYFCALRYCCGLRNHHAVGCSDSSNLEVCYRYGPRIDLWNCGTLTFAFDFTRRCVRLLLLNAFLWTFSMRFYALFHAFS